MTITENFRDFVSTIHKNNGTHNPLDDRYLFVDDKTHYHIYYDQQEKKYITCCKLQAVA